MFTWWKRLTRRRPTSLPRRELAPVEDIVEQGMLVADVAIRMTVKNEIIMNALKRGANYDEAQIRDMVREAINELASERERDSQHIGRVREEVRTTGRSSWSESLYRNSDSRTLKHREEVYEGVAEKLRECAADEGYVAKTAARALEAAWSEIGTSLAERATHPYYSGGKNDAYREARDERIQLLIERDLADLMKDRKGSKLPLKRRVSTEPKD